MTIHESPDARDMTEQEHAVLRQLDVRFGRNGGMLSWQATRVPADPQDGDMPDVARLPKAVFRGKGKPADRGLASAAEHRGTVLCTHPELMHARPENDHAAWGPRSYRGVAEFTAQFLKAYYTDADRPRYLEVFNEPFVKARKMGVTVDALSEQHNHVARRVRELCPGVKVGGYSAAYVELELDNFRHFNSWQRRFMDIAGEEMDFFSYHIYDGVNVMGEPRVRTGSNSEAIMDLIDTYSHIKFGVAKPILITEYGGIPKGGMAPMPYDRGRVSDMLYSLVGQLMTFLDHPDRLEKVIPYILGRGEWTYGADGETKPGDANTFLLWRRDADGVYVPTDLMLFYRFLEGVQGQWRASRSSDPDVRVQLLADGDRLLALLMNLDSEEKPVAISGLERVATGAVRGRFLYTDGDAPRFGERQLDEVPTRLTLRPGAAAMLMIQVEEPIDTDATIREHRVYATECLQPISSGSPVRFAFKDVPSGEGTAVLRLSAGRPPELAKTPTRVLINGVRAQVPENWAGGDQSGRKNFFGMIEIPVPFSAEEPVRDVTIIYPDDGGSVASAVLQVNLTAAR
ncbi:MAG: beta-agarase [Planctomycetota bacterium]